VWVYVVFGLNRDQSTMWNGHIVYQRRRVENSLKIWWCLICIPLYYACTRPDWQTETLCRLPVRWCFRSSFHLFVTRPDWQTETLCRLPVRWCFRSSFHLFVHLFVCCQTCEFDSMVWKWLYTDLMQIGPSGPRVTAWIAQLCGSVGQRSKSRDTKIANKSPFGETSQELSDKS